jgi:hypothetical protein
MKALILLDITNRNEHWPYASKAEGRCCLKNEHLINSGFCKIFNHLQPLSGHEKRASENPEALENIGDRERIRTAGLSLRSFRLLTKT